MASGIARGRVRTTATESRNMAIIIQITAWQRHAALVYCVLLCYWTSMLWSIGTCQNKVSADPYHVTISRAQVNSLSRSRVFWSWSLTKCWIFHWIVGSDLINLLKRGQDCSEGGYANPGLKLKNRIITFSSMQMFFAALFCVYSGYWNSKQKAK